MNKLLQSLLRRHRPDVDALSAHLDGRLEAHEAQILDAHIAGCDACRAEMDGLRSARTALRAMPEATHPRSFRLRAADVERAPVRVGGGGGQAMRLMPVLSGVAAAVFVVAVGADLASGGSSSLKSADTTAMSAARQEAAAAGNYAPSREPAADSALTTRSTTEVPPVAGAYIGEPTVGADAMAPDVAATPAAPGSGALAPESGTPPDTDDASGNKVTIPSPTPELSAASRRPTTNDGIDGLRVVEVVAGAAAVLAAAAAVGWRKRSRGERP